jgi:hypothetical protein
MKNVIKFVKNVVVWTSNTLFLHNPLIWKRNIRTERQVLLRHDAISLLLIVYRVCCSDSYKIIQYFDVIRVWLVTYITYREEAVIIVGLLRHPYMQSIHSSCSVTGLNSRLYSYLYRRYSSGSYWNFSSYSSVITKYIAYVTIQRWETYVRSLPFETQHYIIRCLLYYSACAEGFRQSLGTVACFVCVHALFSCMLSESVFQ